jgi:hypothetical protein
MPPKVCKPGKRERAALRNGAEPIDEKQRRWQQDYLRCQRRMLSNTIGSGQPRSEVPTRYIEDSRMDRSQFQPGRDSRRSRSRSPRRSYRGASPRYERDPRGSRSPPRQRRDISPQYGSDSRRSRSRSPRRSYRGASPRYERDSRAPRQHRDIPLQYVRDYGRSRSRSRHRSRSPRHSYRGTSHRYERDSRRIRSPSRQRRDVSPRYGSDSRRSRSGSHHHSRSRRRSRSPRRSYRDTSPRYVRNSRRSRSRSSHHTYRGTYDQGLTHQETLTGLKINSLATYALGITHLSLLPDTDTGPGAERVGHERMASRTRYTDK